MENKVGDYRDYLKKMEGKVQTEIVASVIWGPDCWDNYTNSVKINLDGSELFDSVATSNQDRSVELGSKPITRKLIDNINVNVSIKVINGTFITSSREHGQTTYEGRVSDLLGGGKTLELGKFGNKVVLKINESSLPREPTLPVWREQ